MKYLLLFYLFVYIYFVISNFLNVRKIRKLINVLSDYLNSASIKSHYQSGIIKKDNYQQCLNEVLFYYPDIVKFKNSFERLEYGVPDKQNYIAAYQIYNELLMEGNFITHKFIDSLNPVYALKKMFKFPSSLISWIGFKPSTMFSKLLNIFCWLLTYILNMYSYEIKLLISTLIHK